jgi:hypothetical protein
VFLLNVPIAALAVLRGLRLPDSELLRPDSYQVVDLGE